MQNKTNSDHGHFNCINMHSALACEPTNNIYDVLRQENYIEVSAFSYFIALLVIRCKTGQI